jgi:hypothetical protein
VVIGSARIFVDGDHVYTVTNAKVGAFRGIQYPDYPRTSGNCRGGRNQ